VFSTELTTRSCDGRAVVALRGELDLADAVAVEAALTAVAACEPQIIVDLAGLEFIDSSGLEALARGRRRARQAGGDLVLAAPQHRVRLVLAITRLTDAFCVYATVEEAADEAGHLRVAYLGLGEPHRSDGRGLRVPRFGCVRPGGEPAPHGQGGHGRDRGALRCS
jgi:anti-sigma B factor antagonist